MESHLKSSHPSCLLLTGPYQFTCSGLELTLVLEVLIFLWLDSKEYY